MNDIENFNIRARIIDDEISSLTGEVRKFLKGKTLIINTDFNGQPFGRSHPSMKGKKFIVDDGTYISFWNGEFVIQPPGTNDSMKLKDCILKGSPQWTR
jgi:hypothetical protein